LSRQTGNQMPQDTSWYPEMHGSCQAPNINIAPGWC
jgi:hypothetical protein